MTKSEAEAHQRKHGFIKGGDASCHSHQPQDMSIRKTGSGSNGAATFKPLTRAMNKTEREYALILEAQKRVGEILRWEYEGITLRWNGIRYTPDFVVLTSVPGEGVKFIEVKGPFIRGKFERAVERFRHAKTYWPEFQFELHQKKGGQWKRIY